MSKPVKSSSWWLLLLTGLVLVVLLLGTASAAAKTVPGGPDPTTNPPTAGIMTYADIVKSLKQIERSSKGAVQVYTLTECLDQDIYDVKTTSELGRELYVAQIGHGPTRVWVSANIHGVEQLTSEALLDVVKKLAAGGSGARQTASRA